MSRRGGAAWQRAPGHSYVTPRTYAQMVQDTKSSSSLPIMSQLPPLAVLGRPTMALPPVSVQQPVLMATFSYDENRSLCFDNSAKRWYKMPPTQENSAQGADLNVGFERHQERPHVPDPLDSVLYTIMHQSRAGLSQEEAVQGKLSVPADSLEHEMLRAQVVTWRGILTKLCTAWSCHVEAPPMFREGFELNVMMLGDTLIMEEVPPTMFQRQSIQSGRPKSRRSQLSSYYGYSFESYCTKSRPGYAQTCGPPGWSGDVNTNVQWGHIVKTKLGHTRIIIGGEVDCVETLDAGTDHEREGVVELKTNLQIQNAEDQNRLDAKMLKMYMQSFLLGVRSIVIGFRDQQGTLLSHTMYRTADLPRMVRGHTVEWNANDNLAFGAAMIDFIRHVVRTETERWSFHFAQRVRKNEYMFGPYAWRVHRSTSAFLAHLPLPALQDAEQEYPVFRIRFEPPFSHVTIRYVPPSELAMDGRRQARCGLVPSDFYTWATEPMAHLLRDEI